MVYLDVKGEWTMDKNGWTWAELDENQMVLVNEAEATLGADYLLAFRASEARTPNSVHLAYMELLPAGLDESQLECLQGLEQKLEAVVVAYRRS
jgi:hypothetical protein